jgi:hypothetical protein
MKISKPVLTIIFICITVYGCTCDNGTNPPGDDSPQQFGIYSETSKGVSLDVDGYMGISYGGGGQFVPNPDSGFVDVRNDVPEGSVCKKTTINVGATGQWAIWFVQYGLTSSDEVTKDMSYYKKGKIKFWVKAEPAIKDLLVGIRSGNVRAGEETSKVLLSNYPSFKVDNQWHEVSIPISDFLGNSPKADIMQIKVFFTIGSSSGETHGTNGNATFWVDNVYWIK